MAPDEATQDKQQAEGQCYCWGLTTASYHRQLLQRKAERAQKSVFFLPKEQQTDLFRNSLGDWSEVHTCCYGWSSEKAKLCCEVTESVLSRTERSDRPRTNQQNPILFICYVQLSQLSRCCHISANKLIICENNTWDRVLVKWDHCFPASSSQYSAFSHCSPSPFPGTRRPLSGRPLPWIQDSTLLPQTNIFSCHPAASILLAAVK